LENSERDRHLEEAQELARRNAELIKDLKSAQSQLAQDNVNLTAQIKASQEQLATLAAQLDASQTRIAKIVAQTKASQDQIARLVEQKQRSKHRWLLLHCRRAARRTNPRLNLSCSRQDLK
jgi:septal ring factor EnvC (AmiA/AmiB activator)